jgi:hypothetical protein
MIRFAQIKMIKRPPVLFLQQGHVCLIHEFSGILFGKTPTLFEEDSSFFGMRKELLIHSTLWKLVAIHILSGAAETFARLRRSKSMETFEILVPFVALANIVQNHFVLVSHLKDGPREKILIRLERN